MPRVCSNWGVATGATVACSEASAVGSKVAIVCRMATETTALAAGVEAAARSGAYSSAVGTALGTSRRLDGNKQDAFGRALAAVQSVDSSIVQEEYNTTAVVTVRDAELLTPTAAPTEDDSTVANAE